MIDGSLPKHEIASMTIDLVVVRELCQRNGIERLRVFGSFARGEAKPGSDLDLIADFSDRKSLLDLVRIEREFAERLGRPVDLLTVESLSPYLRERVLQEARMVYERAA
jgi:uncharacterized protein